MNFFLVLKTNLTKRSAAWNLLLFKTFGILMKCFCDPKKLGGGGKKVICSESPDTHFVQDDAQNPKSVKSGWEGLGVETAYKLTP